MHLYGQTWFDILLTTWWTPCTAVIWHLSSNCTHSDSLCWRLRRLEHTGGRDSTHEPGMFAALQQAQPHKQLFTYGMSWKILWYILYSMVGCSWQLSKKAIARFGGIKTLHLPEGPRLSSASTLKSPCTKLRPSREIRRQEGQSLTWDTCSWHPNSEDITLTKIQEVEVARTSCYIKNSARQP